MTLPIADTSIADWDLTFPTFVDFNSLQAVTAANVINVGECAFWNLGALTNVDLPKAEIIGDSAFSGCNSLATLDIPLVESLGSNVFKSAGTTSLTITMGGTALEFGTYIFDLCGSKIVTVRVPSGASGYATSFLFTAFPWSQNILDGLFFLSQGPLLNWE